MVAQVLVTASPSGRLIDDRRNWAASKLPSGDLRFQLTVLFNWICVPAVLSAVRQLEEMGRSDTVRPVTFKRTLREAHSAARRGFDVAALDEIEDFLSGPSRSWNAIANFGQVLCNQAKTRAERKPSRPNIDDYLVSLGQLMVLGPVVNVLLDRSCKIIFPAFCEFCWRVTLTNQRYCEVHHAHGTRIEGPLSPTGDSYWLARRLKPEFDNRLRQLRRIDKTSNALSAWLLALKTETERHWLAERRPSVFAATAACLFREGPGTPVRHLVAALDSGSRKSDQVRRSFHEQLCRAENERHVYEMTLRAEAWLTAISIRSGSHGGARLGAGRKRIERHLDAPR